MTTPPTVCLLTDFGLEDHYVGVMKGVLLSYLPNAQLVDLTHHVPAQNVRAASFELLAGYRYQPKGTMFVCVVDPEVGSRRAILYAEAGDWRFIAPDNGLLSWVFDQIKPTQILQIDPSCVAENISSTFHGRDVMAPLAGRILSGEDPLKFGAVYTNPIKLPFPVVLKHGSMWQGEILAVDRFGNLITNFRMTEVKPLAATAKLWVEFEKNSTTIRGLSNTYMDGEPGRLIALEGSSGFLEIAINQGTAAAHTNLTVADRVSLHFRA